MFNPDTLDKPLISVRFKENNFVLFLKMFSKFLYEILSSCSPNLVSFSFLPGLGWRPLNEKERLSRHGFSERRRTESFLICEAYFCEGGCCVTSLVRTWFLGSNRDTWPS